jgi:hypothetical protein
MPYFHTLSLFTILLGRTASLAHAIYGPLHDMAYIGPSPECSVVSEFPNHPTIMKENRSNYLFRS